MIKPMVRRTGTVYESIDAVNIPIAEATQINAAVVTPTILSSVFMIAPAPKNPTPVTICPMILDGSIDGLSL